jgi:hypothetical protein
MEKRINLMPDYRCSPLWVYQGGEFLDNPDPDELPVTGELKAALQIWAASYEGTLDPEDPARSGFTTPADRDAFDVEGQRLWRELQAQLGPDYEVLYCQSQEDLASARQTGPGARSQRVASRRAAPARRREDAGQRRV